MHKLLNFTWSDGCVRYKESHCSPKHLVVALEQHVQTVKLGVYCNGSCTITPTEKVDQTALRTIYIINLHLVIFSIVIQSVCKMKHNSVILGRCDVPSTGRVCGIAVRVVRAGKVVFHGRQRSIKGTVKRTL